MCSMPLSVPFQFPNVGFVGTAANKSCDFLKPTFRLVWQWGSLQHSAYHSSFLFVFFTPLHHECLPGKGFSKMCALILIESLSVMVGFSPCLQVRHSETACHASLFILSIPKNFVPLIRIDWTFQRHGVSIINWQQFIQAWLDTYSMISHKEHHSKFHWSICLHNPGPQPCWPSLAWVGNCWLRQPDNLQQKLHTAQYFYASQRASCAVLAKWIRAALNAEGGATQCQQSVIKWLPSMKDFMGPLQHSSLPQNIFLSRSGIQL